MAAKIQLIPQSFDIKEMTANPIKAISDAARTCYRSHNKSSPDNDARLVESLIKRGHTAMLEFASLTVDFTTSRGVANELVRHRLFSFAQESTRYCNYSNGTFYFIDTFKDEDQRQELEFFCQNAANTYEYLVRHNCRPEKARAVLPSCLATHIRVAGNIRQWRHMLALRTGRAAHPEMRELMSDLLEQLALDHPVLFQDLDV